MKVTINEVAEQAGVSIKTVSRVLNNEAPVRPETRAKVSQAIADLGYVANVSAQRLARGRAYTIGLIYHNASWHYITHVLQGVLETGYRAGYSTLLYSYDAKHKDRSRQQILGLASQGSVDGFIFIPPSDNSTALLNDLQSAGVAFVRLTPSNRQLSLPFVTATDWQGAYDMGLYLLGQGHRRIGFIKGPPEQKAAYDRFEGFKAALAEYNVALDKTLVQQGDDHFASGQRCAQAFLKLSTPPTSIFANNDEMAAGANAAVFESGLRVPDDVSIAGFDDIPLSAAIWPPLTTVRQPIYKIAEVATNLLIKLLRDEEPDRLHYELLTELVIRKSVRSIG